MERSQYKTNIGPLFIYFYGCTETGYYYSTYRGNIDTYLHAYMYACIHAYSLFIHAYSYMHMIHGVLQFIQRIGIMLMPVKYQPDLIYLRHVKTKRVHIFTFVQLACFGGMWVVKQIKMTSIAFPVMVIIHSFIHSFIPDFSVTPLQVHYYSVVLPNQDGYCVGVNTPMRQRQL